MKIIDQYIIAIGEKLPLKGREDILEELKSLLLDDIENRFGTEPTEEQVRSAISDFGSPASVAKRYGGENYVINPGLTDIYFLVFRIVIMALTIALITGFIVVLFTGEPTGLSIAGNIKNTFISLWDSVMSAIGVTTIIFIIISRSTKNRIKDPERRWTPDDLKGINIDEKRKSYSGIIVSLVFLVLLLIGINYSPSLLALSEKSFETSGLSLGSRIVPERMSVYILILDILWTATIIYQILSIKFSVKTRFLRISRIVLHWAGLLTLMFMIGDRKLYEFSSQGISSMIGYRGIFVIVLAASFLGLFLNSIEKLMKRRF